MFAGQKKGTALDGQGHVSEAPLSDNMAELVEGSLLAKQGNVSCYSGKR